MTWSVNGVGTGIVKASKKREVNGHIQYDALQAVVFLFLPIIPYKAIHILSIQSSGAEQEQYQSIDLRTSIRLILKAFLNGWSNVLLFAGGCGLPLIGFAFATMPRKLNRDDYMFLTIFIVILALGILAKLLFWFLDSRDQRIRDIMGAHELGTSDPYDWTDDVAESAREGILQDESTVTLIEVARNALTEGDRAGAMIYTRLAMRVESGPDVDAMYAQVLAG